MQCLDANDVRDLMAGVLDSTTRSSALAHVDTCENCRALVNAISLQDTQAASDVAEVVGDAATLLPQDARPVSRPSSLALPQTGGKRLGRFTMTERLGAGAMGVVWRAEDPNLGRNVALKLLKRADEALTERLVREARSMAQVNHPNVVTVYEVGESEDGTTFIAMELVTGQSLRVWQDTKRPTIPELVAAYIAAGRGLGAAHAAGIVHRDFKPDNVLVGDDGRVRVTDFGLAAAKPSGGATPQVGDLSLTTAGSLLGTPAYMAPEQFNGGNVDTRTDQFNFCVALYEALYGERPYAGDNLADLSSNVMDGVIKAAPPGTRVSSALRAILLRGLSVKPGDRFPTMGDLIIELGRDRARPWRRTALASAALAAALGLGLVADWAVRDRLAAEINQSFALTGVQVERAVGALRDQFDTVSQIAYREPALREVAAHRDQEDFGLGNADDDRAERERLHNTLVSTEWVRVGTSTLAIVDYKGRLLYASAAPNEWGKDLTALPFVKRALDAGKGDSVTVFPYADPAIQASGLLPQTNPRGLAVVFARTLSLGDKQSDGNEARALYLQLQDGQRLLDNVRLDNETLLGLVAAGADHAGYADAGVTLDLVHAALATSGVTEAESGGSTYQVQARPISGLDGQGTIAHVVMARPLDGVLSLFPGARLVFALTAFCALALALATALRARAITSGRL